MSCVALTTGLAGNCTTGTNGISHIYITNLENITAITETTGNVSAITMGGTPTTKFYEYVASKDTAEYTEKSVINIESQTSFWEGELTIAFNRRSTAKRQIIQTLASAGPLAILFVDRNGTHWLIGVGSSLTEGVYLESVEGGTGKAMGDASNYTLKFKTQSKSQAYTVTDTVISPLT